MIVRVLIPAIPLALLCAAFIRVMPAAALWRDTGQFILSAFFLDISHPPGFPLYGQLANAAALVPIGPIAWRVHCFSLLVGIACVLLTYELCRYFLKHFTHAEGRLIPWVSVLPALLICSSPIFLKQIFTAEAYVLNCVAIQLLLYLYLRAIHKNDLRYLVLAAFCAGLFPGNHITIALAYPPLLLLIVLRFRRYKNILLPAFLFGLWGLGIFAYVPARSIASPPPNTVGASVPPGFLNLGTSIRDRESDTTATPDGAAEPMTLKESGSSLILSLVSDLQIIQREISLAVFALALTGIICIVLYRGDVGVVLLWIGLSHWYFFRDWRPDSWIPLLFILLFCATISVALIVQALSDVLSEKLVYSLGAFFVGLFTFYCSSTGLRHAADAKASLAAVSLTRMQLARVPAQSVIISERSRFLHACSILIEGYRSDLLPLHLRQISEPELSAPFTLTMHGAPAFTSEQLVSGKAAENFSRFLSAVAPLASIAYEPAVVLSESLRSETQLEAAGLGIIRHGEESGFDSRVITDLPLILATYNNQAAAGWEPYRREAQSSIASYATSVGQALSAQEEYEAAVSFYTRLCAATSCNAVLLNNFAASLIHAGQYSKAAALLEQLTTRSLSKSDRIAARQNLRAAYAGLRRRAREK